MKRLVWQTAVLGAGLVWLSACGALLMPAWVEQEAAVAPIPSMRSSGVGARSAPDAGVASSTPGRRRTTDVEERLGLLRDVPRPSRAPAVPDLATPSPSSGTTSSLASDPEFYRYYSPRYGSSLAHDPAYYPYYRHLYSSSLAADPAYYRYFQDRYLGPPAGPLGRNEP